VAITYQLLIDTAGDQSYAHNVGDALLAVEWGRGRNDRIGIADVGQLQAILQSPNGEYHLQGANRIAGVAPGKRVKLQAVTPTFKRLQLFQGFIRDLVPQLGEGGGPWRAQLLAEDAGALLQDAEIAVPSQRGYRLDTLVNDILNRAGWAGGRDVNFWGSVPVASVAGIDTRTAYEALAELCDATGGIFFIDGQGIARFWGHNVRQSGRPAAVAKSVIGLEETYGQAAPDVVTEVRVTVNPAADVGPVEIWSAGEFLLKAKRANGRWFTWHTDENVTSVIPPVTDVDYRAVIDDHQAPQSVQGDRKDEWLHLEVYPRGPHDGSLFVWNDGGPNNRRVRVKKLRIRAIVFRALDPVVLTFSGPVKP
jgi:hypothetical protein